PCTNKKRERSLTFPHRSPRPSRRTKCLQPHAADDIFSLLWLTVYIITPSTPRERVETARKTVLPHNLRLCSQVNLSVGPATVKPAILSCRNQGSVQRPSSAGLMADERL